MRNGVKGYASSLKFFHWMIALIVMGMLSFSFFLGDLPDAWIPSAFTVHKSFGLTVLGLVILYLINLMRKGKPPLPASVPKWQHYASRIVHSSLFILLLAMPLSGWIMSTAANRSPVYFWLVTLPFPGISPDQTLASFFNKSHKTMALILIGFVIVHIAAALKHHFLDKDEVLKRMLP